MYYTCTCTSSRDVCSYVVSIITCTDIPNC